MFEEGGNITLPSHPVPNIGEEQPGEQSQKLPGVDQTTDGNQRQMAK